MLPTINLHRQLQFRAVKVEYVRLDRKLATKLLIMHSAAAQHRPEQMFGIG
ncbi:MAG: hypothetical protein M3Q13_03525 [Pseudomonadota bacterium]|nr:hypothetical protein [Pseudomonadota bacterium]